MQCRWIPISRLGRPRLILTRPCSRTWATRLFPDVAGPRAQHPSHARIFTSTSSFSRQRRKDIIATADTIYALSTAPGRGAIAIIRISGPACLDIYGSLCPDKLFPHPRTATLRKLFDPTDSSRVLDSGALVLYFPAPKTVTGENLLELHLHGGQAIIRSVLEAIPRCIDSRPRRRNAEYSHIRAAEPGEFTKRAFYNGRLDLTQAEALGETLAAETEQQRRLAVAGVDSGLADRYEGWRKMLLYARGELEALIDFSEDQHFDDSPAEFMKSISEKVVQLNRQIELHLNNAARGELLRSGISVALLGAPNAGKSSLLNQIVGREAAIVTAEAGTTRDIVDVSVDISGWLVRLGDMAGLRGNQATQHDTQSVDHHENRDVIGLVEREGIRRARARALQSDLVIVLLSVLQSSDSRYDLAVNRELLDAAVECHRAGKEILFVINKADLIPTHDRANAEIQLRQRVLTSFSFADITNIFLISCKNAALADDSTTGSDPSGLQAFLQGLTNTFRAMTSAAIATNSAPDTSMSAQESQSYWTMSLSVTHRQSTHLARCLRHLGDFLAQTLPQVPVKSQGPPLELPSLPEPQAQQSHSLITDSMEIKSPSYGATRNTQLGPTPTMVEQSIPMSQFAATFTPSSEIKYSHHVDGHEDLVAEVAVDHDDGNGLSYATVLPRPRSHLHRGRQPDAARDDSSRPTSAIKVPASEPDESIHEVEFDIVTAAEHLRYAADCLAKITGRGEGGDVEDVLGVVFEK